MLLRLARRVYFQSREYLLLVTSMRTMAPPRPASHRVARCAKYAPNIATVSAIDLLRLQKPQKFEPSTPMSKVQACDILQQPLLCRLKIERLLHSFEFPPPCRTMLRSRKRRGQA
jgi:hypothetical protein